MGGNIAFPPALIWFGALGGQGLLRSGTLVVVHVSSNTGHSRTEHEIDYNHVSLKSNTKLGYRYLLPRPSYTSLVYAADLVMVLPCSWRAGVVRLTVIAPQ